MKAIAMAVMLMGLWVTPAGAVLFDLSSCAQAGLGTSCNNTDTGLHSLTYTLAGVTMGASASEDLVLKDAGPGETGLGVFPEGNHEIDSSGLLTLDFSDLAGRGAAGGILTVSSLQSGEVGHVTDTLGTHAISDTGGTLSGDVVIAFSKLSPLVTVTAASGDVLVASEVSVVPSVTPIPEPTPESMILLGLCAVAIFGMVYQTIHREGMSWRHGERCGERGGGSGAGFSP